VERRRSPRFRLQLPVLTQWTGREGSVRYGGRFSRDVCLRGIFVVSSNLPPPAAVIAVVLPNVHAVSQELPSNTGNGGRSSGVAGPFLGIATNHLNYPWPASLVPVASWRSLGGQVKWADINIADGVNDFSHLDEWLSKAQAGGQDVMFTMYATSSWASSRGINCTAQGNPVGCLGPPNTGCGFQSQNGPGICDPPNDLNCDGTGSNLHFQNFVTALISHVGSGKIKRGPRQ
jgi:hypothetical protein